MSTHLNGESSPDSSVTESPFQGIKMAKVSISEEKMKFIKYAPKSRNPDTVPVIMKGILKAPSIDKYSLKCSVNLFRDDLRKIQDVFSKKASGKVTPNNFSPVGFQCNINEKLSPNNYVPAVPDPAKPKKSVSFSNIVTIIEVNEYYRCKKCPRVFYSRKTMKSHLKKMHKKKQLFICSFCEKQFMDRMFFKVHMKLHCDVCGLLLPSRAKCLEHRRTVCRTLHKCPSCGSKFFHKKDLRHHIYDHLEQCCICDMCQDKFDNKCATAHHIRFLHSMRRPKSMYTIEKVGVETLFVCNFCDESNVDKDLIEEHQTELPDLSNRRVKGNRDNQCKKKFKLDKCLHFLDSNDKSHKNPKAEQVNTPDNSDMQVESHKKIFERHNAQDYKYSNDSFTAEKSVSPLNFEKENIETNNNSNSNDIYNTNLIDLLNSKSTLPPFLSKSKIGTTDNMQHFYKWDEVPKVMFKPKVVLKRCKINGEDVTREMSIIDLKRHNVSEGKVMKIKITATRDLDMIVSQTTGIKGGGRKVGKIQATNDEDEKVMKNPANSGESDEVVKSSATSDVKDTYKTTKDHILIEQNIPMLEKLLTATSTTASPFSSGTDLQPPETDLQPPGTDLQPPGTDLQSSATDLQSSGTDPQLSATELQPSGTDPQPSATDLQPPGTDFQPPAEKRSRKTLISKHQCTTCGQYYSSAYCLRRHISSVHYNLESLQCRVCEETFVWPSLLFSHKCIRLNSGEMLYEGAQTEVHFDNVESLHPEQFRGMNIQENERYGMNIQGNDSYGVNIRENDSYGMNIRDIESYGMKIQENVRYCMNIRENESYGIDIEIPQPMQEGVLNRSNVTLNQNLTMAQVLAQPHSKPNGLTLLPDTEDEFAHLPNVLNPIIPQMQIPLLQQTNLTQNTFAQKSTVLTHRNGLNRQVHTVTRPNQCPPNEIQHNHSLLNGMHKSQLAPNTQMQLNNQQRPVTNQNSILNGKLPVAQLERMGYKLVMEEVPIEFQ